MPSASRQAAGALGLAARLPGGLPHIGPGLTPVPGGCGCHLLMQGVPTLPLGPAWEPWVVTKPLPSGQHRGLPGFGRGV